MMTDAPLYLSKDGAIGELVLNQPARRNAINAAMWRAMPGLLADAAADSDIRVLLVHGGGGGCFAAGADISEFETVYATQEAAQAYSASIQTALDQLSAFPKPVIAAIEGPCVGGGCGVALACDLRLANHTAKFAITPGKLGLVYGPADTRRLIEAVGTAKAKEMLFTGRMVPAEEARALGLVTTLLDDAAIIDAAKAWVEALLATSQWSLQATKRMMGLLSPEAAVEGDKLFMEGFGAADFQEGYSAFLAKRPAKFHWRGEI